MAKYKGLLVGVNTVRKIMESHRWVPPYSRVRREPKGERRFEACRRNALWHTDFKHAFISNSKIYILIIQDDYSRFVVGYAIVSGETTKAVLDALKEAVEKHGKPEELMTDGGSAFHAWKGVSEVTRFLEEGGIDHYVARTPNINGKIENLNQQIDKELLLTKNYASIEEFSSAFERWISFYHTYPALSRLCTRHMHNLSAFCPGDSFPQRFLRFRLNSCTIQLLSWISCAAY